MNSPTTPTDLLTMSISSVEFQHLQGFILSKGRGLPPCSSLTMVAPLGLALQLCRHLVNKDLQQGGLVEHSHHVDLRHGGLGSHLLHVGLCHVLHLGRGGLKDIDRFLWVLRYKYLPEHCCIFWDKPGLASSSRCAARCSRQFCFSCGTSSRPSPGNSPASRLTRFLLLLLECLLF
jgi:hypothetical protein